MMRIIIKILIILIISLILQVKVNAQTINETIVVYCTATSGRDDYSLNPQIFSSTGAFYTTTNCSISQTVGESVIETYIVQDNVLNTGFHQVDTFIPITRTWNGSVDDNWDLDANWAETGVPVSIDNVSIPTTAPRMPVVRITGLSCRKITLETGASLQIVPGVVLRVCGN